MCTRSASHRHPLKNKRAPLLFLIALRFKLTVALSKRSLPFSPPFSPRPSFNSVAVPAMTEIVAKATMF